MVALPKLAPSRMTVAEFLAWPGDGSGRRFELVDGEIRAMAPASITHGIIQSKIGRLLGNHLDGTRCHVVTAPGIIPRARSNSNFRIPDLAINCVPDEPRQSALRDPLLIVEILSPSNEAETRENVWAHISIPSLREILLVSSTAVAAELLRRQPDGNWPDQPEALDSDGEVTLESIDFRAHLRDFSIDTYLLRSGYP